MVGLNRIHYLKTIVLELYQVIYRRFNHLTSNCQNPGPAHPTGAVSGPQPLRETIHLHCTLQFRQPAHPVLVPKLCLRLRLFKPFSVQCSRTLHIICSLEAGSATSFAERQGQLEPDLVGCNVFYDTTRQVIPLELREGVADLRPRMNVKLAACFILPEISLWAYYECAISELFRRAF